MHDGMKGAVQLGLWLLSFLIYWRSSGRAWQVILSLGGAKDRTSILLSDLGEVFGHESWIGGVQTDGQSLYLSSAFRRAVCPA